MLKKLLLAVATMIATMGFAFAQVDVNKADQAALDSVKGIGPKTSKAILDERKKGGEFKDWADLQKRVKGVGDKSAEKLSDAGLTVNGQPKPKTSSASATKDDKKTKAASGKDTKSSAAQDAKPAASSGGTDTKAGGAKPADAKAAQKDAKKEEPKK